jgi:PLP dependent protein
MIATRLNTIQNQIADALKSAKRSDDVTLIAVSKTQPIEAIQELYGFGHRDFGENYVQELTEKAQTLLDEGITDIRWHFIGHLQTNKVKQLLPYVTSIQSVDSIRLAQEISKRLQSLHAQTSEESRKLLPIFLNVNIDQEESKDGVAPIDAREVCEAISTLPGLSLEGLMCIPAPSTPESQHLAFHRLRELEYLCRPFTHGQLSMGMSSDFAIAIQEGATHVRVGTSLFGQR